jgi:Peptidase S24-like
MQIQQEALLMWNRLRSADFQSKQEARLDLAAEVLHRFGEVRLVAQGSSMIPSIYPGDLLTVRSESIAGARCGEIVLFLLGGRFFVHRVIRKWPDRNRTVFATRGDALAHEDPSIDGTQLLGRVTAILRHGKTVKCAAHLNPWNRFLRWTVRNSEILARTLLAAHLLRCRIPGGSSFQESEVTPGKEIQECV